MALANGRGGSLGKGWQSSQRRKVSKKTLWLAFLILFFLYSSLRLGAPLR
jgi:hypothetical protein